MYQQLMDYFREGLWLQKAEAEEHTLKTTLIDYLKIFTLAWKQEHSQLRNCFYNTEDG
jgi:hypothetical protein